MRAAVMKLLGVVLGSTVLLAGCGGGGGGDAPPPPATDTTPAQFSFTDQSGVATSTMETSAAVTITGINAPSAVTVSGGTYSVGCTATYVSTAGTISNGQTVCARQMSAATASTATNTTLTIGGISDVFTTMTAAGSGSDTTPNPYSFTDQTGVATSTVVTSAAVTITGIDAPAAVTVSGGTYSVGCTATYVGTAGTISNNQTVCARHTSAATASTATNTTLTVGGVSDVFTSTTAAAGADTTPNPFTFADQTGVATSTVMTSAPVTITGINAAAAVTVSGGTYSVGCTATYVGTAGTISNGQTVCARHTSAATASTATNTTLTVGGVSDVFTSTTADPLAAIGMLPFVTGSGSVQLFDPTAAASGSNPATVDTGLAPPPAGPVCIDCFGQAETYFTATVSGTTLSNLHAARLVYAKRASGNDSGAAVYRVNLTQGASNAPAQVSSLTDACRIVRSETTDVSSIDNTAVVIERAGPDLSCSATADNVATVIRLNSTTADGGVTLPLALDTGNPLHARTSATGAVVGYVSFEVAGVDSYLLVRRDADLGNPVTLLSVGQTTGANLERADFTHLFVTATPSEQGMQLFRVETDGTLSPALYFFSGFNAGNPIQDGVRDAVNLYFSDENRLLSIPVDATTESAVLLTTMPCVDSNSCQRIENRALDAGSGRVVFEAQDQDISVAGGVFSVPTTATDDPATLLAHNGDSLGGYAYLQLTTGGRAYINIAHHGGIPTHVDALKINTDGTAPFTNTAAYWAGSTLATSFDLTTVYSAPAATIFLGTRLVNEDGTGTDTLYAVDPATGVTGAALGSFDNASVYMSTNVSGLGRYALARVERDRAGNLDYDVFRLDAESASSFVPLAETAEGTDLPLDSLQRLTGNLCLVCL